MRGMFIPWDAPQVRAFERYIVSGDASDLGIYVDATRRLGPVAVIVDQEVPDGDVQFNDEKTEARVSPATFHQIKTWTAEQQRLDPLR